MMWDIALLKKKFDAGENLSYIFFWGHTTKKSEPDRAIFSQWYPAAFAVDQHIFQTAEHWMMYEKARLFNNVALLQKILAAKSPGVAKSLGRQVQNFNEDIWLERRSAIVKEGNFHKFQQHPELLSFLLSTKEKILVEASPSDYIWGIGMSENEQGIENPHNWPGLNLLGFALMEVREYFLHEK